MIVKKNSIKIKRVVYEQIIELASKSKDKETGGIIAGSGVMGKSDIIITNCSTAGKNSIRQKFFFSRDTKHCQKILNQWVEESCGKIDYLGEWHKHLEINPKPSYTDLKTMSRINEDNSYHISSCIMLIVGLSNKINAFIENENSYKEIVLNIVED